MAPPDDPRIFPPGEPHPLGATWDGKGVNFALFSEHATAVELCLYDRDGNEQHVQVRSRSEGGVWHVYLPGVGPSQRYGYRVHGPWDPANGHRFNPAKLVLDPYARAIAGPLVWNDAVFGHVIGDDLVRDDRDSAPFVSRSVVIDSAFDWEDDRPPRVPWHETIIYEAHVKGFTQLHPGVPEPLRGTYAGLANDAAIAHLTSLGVTAVELMPVHHFVTEQHLADRGLVNYWGYNSIGFFAPDARYAHRDGAHDTVAEFKGMVKALHRAGLEVILDVVYNHTAEGNHQGPTLAFRGIDNASYYRLVPDDKRFYMDYTGCGNTLNMTHPRSLQLIMDSLRYWIQEMHVDGFRFDLASALARELDEVDRLGAFFDTIQQDPVVSRVKLIAEPWDLGPDGYQVGNFPSLWAEWNGQYRDAARAFWRGDEGHAGVIAARLTGSSDLYGGGGRKPYASINFITAHDGFTLRDLVSYNAKHNEANGEQNADGHDDNLSWNCGVEGPTDNAAVVSLRLRQQRNLLAMLLFSQGVPMLTAGDEMSKTQQGNNNAYCQDNEISWLNWTLEPPAKELLAFTRRVIAVRRENPALRRHQFMQGRPLHGSDVKDLAWFRPDGEEMTDEDWGSFVRAIGMRLAGDAMNEVDARGERVTGDTLLVLLNAHHEPLDFTLPDEGASWEMVIDTRSALGPATSAVKGGAVFSLESRSLALFRLAVRRTVPRKRTA